MGIPPKFKGTFAPEFERTFSQISSGEFSGHFRTAAGFNCALRRQGAAAMHRSPATQRAHAARTEWLWAAEVMSRVIGFRSHHMMRDWDRHWRYASRLWCIVHGARPNLPFRRPLCAHLLCLAKCGFVLAPMNRDAREPAIRRDVVPQGFRGSSEVDLSTASTANATIALRVMPIEEAAGSGMRGN